jgi:hypothetical protein
MEKFERKRRRKEGRQNVMKRKKRSEKKNKKKKGVGEVDIISELKERLDSTNSYEERLKIVKYMEDKYSIPKGILLSPMGLNESIGQDQVEIKILY